MTTTVDIVNRALQSFGKRTTVTAAELLNNSSNEAIQANIAIHDVRKELLRMAPWDCGLSFNNLVYITSQPGTPENPPFNGTPQQWIKGFPAPPWAYEFQYPIDCLKACWLIPQTSNNSVAIYPVTTGWAPFSLGGPAAPFKVSIDQFRPVISAAVAAGGTNYAVGDDITLTGTPDDSLPIGAPAILRVLTISGSSVTSVEVLSQVPDAAIPQGGSYFRVQANPVGQASTTGIGSGATFNLTFQSTQISQRVILCNEQIPILAYVKDVSDIDVMDPLFQNAWVESLGATLCFTLTGDKALANACIQKANQAITQARTADGNEGLTVNDSTPDWLRVRGIRSSGWPSSMSFNWGPLWPLF